MLVGGPANGPCQSYCQKLPTLIINECLTDANRCQCERPLRKECKKREERRQTVINQFQTAVRRLCASSRAAPDASGADTQSCCCHAGIWCIISRASHLRPHAYSLLESYWRVMLTSVSYVHQQDLFNTAQKLFPWEKKLITNSILCIFRKKYEWYSPVQKSLMWC